MRKAFVAPRLEAEARLSEVTLGLSISSTNTPL